MKYVEQKWNSYAAACVPAPPGTPQYEETRKAFYAAGVVVMAAVERTGDPEVTEDAGAAFLQELGNELRSFVSGVKQRAKAERYSKGRDTRVDPEVREIDRSAAKAMLLCEAQGFDDASCLAFFERYNMSAKVAVELFRMMQLSEMPNRMALGLTLLAHKAALEAIKAGVGE